MYKKLLNFSENQSVNKDKNPFYVKLNEISEHKLQEVLMQYSLFPKTIISILISATYNLNYFGFDKVSYELIQNINEELGRYTDETILVIPKPHYTILRKGFFEGLNIEINYTKPSKSTSKFIYDLKEFVDSPNKYEVLGSVFAIESSAIPELEIVIELVKKLFEIKGKQIPEYLVNFFQYHIDDIEIGHRDRFYKLCLVHLKTEENKKDFEIGFKKVMNTMDKWWIGLNNEIESEKSQLPTTYIAHS
jgi:hypothetical protein